MSQRRPVVGAALSLCTEDAVVQLELDDDVNATPAKLSNDMNWVVARYCGFMFENDDHLLI